MGLKPGYKQTEVGVIPGDWVVHSIGDSMRLINGRGFSPNEWGDSGLPIIRIQNLNSSESAFNYFNGSADEKHLVRAGDLLFAWSGTTGTSFGARVWSGPTGVLNQHIFKVVPNEDKVSHDYAYLVLHKVQEQIEKQAHGFKSSFVHVKKSDLVDVRLPLPSSTDEQRAITAALSDVDALLAKLDQLIAKKRDLKQAAMQQLLTGQTRLPGFEGEWDVTDFGSIAKPRRDRADPRKIGALKFCVELEHIEQGTGQLTGCTEADETASLKTLFRPGDVLFGKLRAYLRKYWLADRPGACSTEIWALEPAVTRVSSEFLLQLVKSDAFIDVASTAYGTHMPRSEWSVVKALQVRLPPKSEQSAITSILSDMDAELDALEGRRDKAHQLKQGMMQELLTGRIRLVQRTTR